MASFVAHKKHRSQLTSQIWASKCGGNGIMSDPYPHPQHMKIVNDLMCLKWMWEPFHVGLEPQPLHHGIILWAHQWPMISADFLNLGHLVLCKLPPLHHGIIFCTQWTHDFSRLSKSGQASVVVTAWWHQYLFCCEGKYSIVPCFFIKRIGGNLVKIHPHQCLQYLLYVKYLILLIMIPNPQVKIFCGLLPRLTQYFWPWEWEFIPDYWAKNRIWYKSYQCFMVLLKTHEYCQFYIHCLLFLMSWQHLCLHCLMTGDCPSAGFSLKSIAWVFCHNSDSDNYNNNDDDLILHLLPSVFRFLWVRCSGLCLSFRGNLYHPPQPPPLMLLPHRGHCYTKVANKGIETCVHTGRIFCWIPGGHPQ